MLFYKINNTKNDNSPGIPSKLMTVIDTRFIGTKMFKSLITTFKL